MNNNFKAMEISENGETFERNIIQRSISDLPEGDILINVKYSSLNYKDALSASGNKGVTRNYPHTPGIDAAGIIAKSNTDKFKVGDEVLVTGYDLGMNTSGGFSEYIRVPSDWVVKLPKGLSLKESMAYGTAGFTAALSVYKLINGGVKAEDGEILVTGATGGVGSVAIALLNNLGYEVIAATGKIEERDTLISFGAKDIINRSELNDESGRILLKSKWAGVIDTVGGNMLATAIKTTKYNGVITCCGNVASHELLTNVYPFILRGVSLLGVDSVQCDMETRLNVWSKLATEWKIDNNSEVIDLEDVNDKIDLMLKGKHKGRTIIKI
ncbi:MAG: YhdH/YhfP family quinone oxidoreductase [Acidaminobacteraceae bacterium]